MSAKVKNDRCLPPLSHLPHGMHRDNFHFACINQYTAAARMTVTVFWDGTSCNLVPKYRRFWVTYPLHLQDRRISFLHTYSLCSSPLRLEPEWSNKTPVSNYQTTWHHMPKGRIFHCHCHKISTSHN